MQRPRLLTSIWISLLFGGASYAQHHDDEHGEVDFPISGNEQAQHLFDTALAHLHHMMYERARPVFEQADEADAECDMAHWGIAMTSFQSLRHPAPPEGLERILVKAAFEARCSAPPHIITIR